ncbi:Small secreted protein OS=Streptomyces antimycoticus OX=68175 GN=SSPO_053990 PE=4 SV=1 [Streptomyces antimycoticus]
MDVYVPGPRAMEGTNPVNKKLVAALSGGAALVLALTGCGGGDEDKKVDDWAKSVCDEVQPQLKKIQGANTAIQGAADEQDSKKLQQTDSKAFQEISESYGALAKAVNKAGPPPVDNGDKTQQQAVRELNATSGAYTGEDQAVLRDRTPQSIRLLVEQGFLRPVGDDGIEAR